MCPTSDDVILEMEFVSRQDSSVNSDKEPLIIAGKALKCTNWADRLVTQQLQVTRTLALGELQIKLETLQFSAPDSLLAKG